MRYNTGLQISRRTDAQRLTNKLLELLQSKSFKQYGIQDDRAAQLAFMTGYINSVLSQVAAASPASLKELESTVNWMDQ
jgi:hypothetical protein